MAAQYKFEVGQTYEGWFTITARTESSVTINGTEYPVVEAGLDASAHTAGEKDLCIVTNCGEADTALDCAVENILEALES